MKDDPLFEEEQRQLSQTYEKLQAMSRDLTAKMAKNIHDAAADKRALCDDVSPNFASYSDAMETYADYATINRVVDAYNITQSVDAEKLNSIRLLLKQPYFAKIVLQFKAGEDPKELYIGAAGVSDDARRRLVVDWRSPVAEVYYNQDNGPTSYEANGRTIEVDLKLRRQFDIVEDKLHAYFDTHVAIEDALLRVSLSKRRTARMQAITATIQKEQNVVIRHEDVPVLLVRGIAGSGKTSVLMQRIAYLFYRQREKLDPREVFLITPNPVFQRYVNQVLPDLGESNPVCLTWNEFLRDVMPASRIGAQADVPRATLRRIDEAGDRLTFDSRDFKEVRAAGMRFLSVAHIQQVAAKFKNIAPGPHLVTLMREELIARVENRFKHMAETTQVLDEIASLSPDEQMGVFGETFNGQDEEEARRWARRFVSVRYADALVAVENDEWLRIDRIGMRLLGVENLGCIEWLYVKMALTGLSNAEARYVMIDEVQDYTAAQLVVLARYFRRAHFVLLGDENQAINPHTATFDEIRAIGQELRGSVDECRLMTSYRSSPQITEMFAHLVDEDTRMRISSIQREQRAPEVITCATDEEYQRKLQRVIREASQDAALAAVIVPHKHAARHVQEMLDEHALPLIDADSTLPERGVVLTSLAYAKGLEFDHVIVPDVSKAAFPDDALSRRRLYTTVSRATHQITLLAKGEPTVLLTQPR